MYRSNPHGAQAAAKRGSFRPAKTRRIARAQALDDRRMDEFRTGRRGSAVVDHGPVLPGLIGLSNGGTFAIVNDT